MSTLRSGQRLLGLALLLFSAGIAAAQPRAQPDTKPGDAQFPDTTIYAKEGHAIGQVAGVVLDAADHPAYAVVAHDVDTGLEVELVAVPWPVLLASKRGQRIVLDEQQLGTAPTVTEQELVASAQWRSRSDRFWRAARPQRKVAG